MDCNLPRGHERERFFKFVSSKNILKLDLLCLTHPHEDHYTGMDAVVEYFTSNGHSIGVFCDSGIDPRQISLLLRKRKRPPKFVQEFDRLYVKLREFFKSEKIEYIRADRYTATIPLGLESNRMQLLPLGPKPQISNELAFGELSSEGFRGDLNRISVVLALMVQRAPQKFDALLAADTDGEGFNSAREGLMAKTQTRSAPCFDFVKVAHHGSLDSHRNSEACLCRKVNRECIAAISAGSKGDFNVLPDREVLSDYLNNKWKVILTTKRIRADNQSLLNVFGGKPGQSTSQDYDLCITWSAGKGLRYTPLAATLDHSELGAYQTAKRK